MMIASRDGRTDIVYILMRGERIGRDIQPDDNNNITIPSLLVQSVFFTLSGSVVMQNYTHPRRTYAARVTVATWFVSLSVLSVSSTFSATAAHNETTKQRYERVHHHTGFILKKGDFRKWG